MPSNHLILCRPLLLLSSAFPNIRVFSSELALHIRWPKYWSFSITIFLYIIPFDRTTGSGGDTPLCRGHKPSESPGCLSKDRHPVSGAAQTGSVDSETSGHHEDERRWNGWFTVRCWRRAGSGSACEKGMLHTLPGEGPEVGGVDSQSVGGSLKLLFDFSRTQVVLQFERALGSGLMY